VKSYRVSGHVRSTVDGDIEFRIEAKSEAQIRKWLDTCENEAVEHEILRATADLDHDDITFDVQAIEEEPQP
jgi:acylphosphatase